MLNQEKRKQDSKKEVVIINGDKYVVSGSKMDKVMAPSKPAKKKEDVCLTFCKFGSCSNPTCPNRHDPALVRMCPAFLRVWNEVKY